jgi:TolA-binding protein
VRLAAILLASGAAAFVPAASALAQDYGQPYPLNQYPQAPAYQQPYQQQPYQPAPQPFAPEPVAPQVVTPQGAPGQADQLGSREGIALQNQILELRRDLQNLQAQGPSRRGYAQPAPRGGAESDLLPQLLDRVSNLEDEVRRLRGEVEDERNQLQRQQEDFSKQLGDMQFRLQNGGGAAAPGTPGVGASPDSGVPPEPVSKRPAAPPPAAPRRTPELTMQEGNAALARRDYGTAAAAAHEVLGAGRTGPRAGDAQMLLAQALAGKRDYQGAAVAYGDAYQRLKGGSRGQDALLGLANSLSAIGEKPATCGALDQLRAAYPSPRRDVREAAASLRGRAGCR